MKINNKFSKKIRKSSKLPLFVPMFDKKLARMVSDFFFIPDAKIIGAPNETIQILGNLAFIPSMGKKIDDLKINFSQLYKLIISGGINQRYKKWYNIPETPLVKYLTEKSRIKWKDVLSKSEASLINRILTKKIKKKIVLETKSTNTKENFIFAINKNLYGGTKRLVLLTPAISAVRAKMTALKQLKKLGIKSIETISYPEQFPFKNPLRRKRWTMSREVLVRHGLAGWLARSWVWGEIQRIMEYSLKGDIVFFGKKHQQQFLNIMIRICNITRNREIIDYCNKIRKKAYYNNSSNFY